MFLHEISIFSIYQKLGLVGPVQQKIKLPLPNIRMFIHCRRSIYLQSKSCFTILIDLYTNYLTILFKFLFSLVLQWQ